MHVTRPIPWTRRGERWTWIGLGGFLAAILVALVIGIRQHAVATKPPVINGMACLATQTPLSQVHIDFYIDGTSETIPSGIGYDATAHCYYGIYTNTANGVVQVALTQADKPTLADFFALWNKPLSATNLAGLQSGAKVGTNTESIRVYVNGTRYSGNPADIALRPNTEIALAYGPPWPKTIPSRYDFSAASATVGSTSSSSSTSSSAASTSNG